MTPCQKCKFLLLRILTLNLLSPSFTINNREREKNTKTQTHTRKGENTHDNLQTDYNINKKIDMYSKHTPQNPSASHKQIQQKYTHTYMHTHTTHKAHTHTQTHTHTHTHTHMHTYTHTHTQTHTLTHTLSAAGGERPCLPVKVKQLKSLPNRGVVILTLRGVVLDLFTVCSV